LVISDSLRVSTITTSNSPTPTFTELSHLASSFPQPPSYIPVLSTPPTTTYPVGSSATRAVTYPDTTPFTSPTSEVNLGSIITLQRIKSRAKDIFRIPSFLSSLKSRS
jgi:hypothetical protein